MPDDNQYQMMDLEHGSYGGGASSGGRRRRHRRRKKKARLKKFLGGILVLLLVVFGIWYVMDNMMMYWFVLFNDNDSVERRQSEELGTWSSNYGTSSGNSWGASNLGYGSQGAPTVKGGLPHIQSGDDLSQYTSKEYIMRFVIFMMDQAGYVPNATIGVMSNMIGEGLGFGTFTYEGYYCVTGPSGVLNDMTLDNNAWREWFNPTAVTQLHSKTASYRNKWSDVAEGERGKYGAVGLGLTQETNSYTAIKINGQPTEIQLSTSTYRANMLLDKADEKGYYWQDPAFQIDYIVNEKMASYGDALFEVDKHPGVDPKTSVGVTSEEWARRFLCSYEQPVYDCLTVESAAPTTYNTHCVAPIQECTEMYSKYSYKDPLFYSSDGSLNSGSVDPIAGTTITGQNYISGNNAALRIAQAAITLCFINPTLPDDDPGVVSGQFSNVTPIEWNPNRHDSDIDWDNLPSDAVTEMWVKDNYFLITNPWLQPFRTAKINMGEDLKYYASCDRTGVMCIKMSGADVDFPSWGGAGNVQDTLGQRPEYWQLMGTCDKVEEQPGDILTSGGHVIVYVGVELMQLKFGKNSTANCFESSWGDFLDRDGNGIYTNGIFPRATKNDMDGMSGFKVWRCINKNPVDKYINIMSGAT